MKYPRQRTDEANESIENTMREVREAHQRTVATHDKIAEEIRRERQERLINAAISYKPGVFVWLLFIAWAYFLLS